MSHAFLFYFFLKTNSINFVLFIRNARAPSLKFMYKILNIINRTILNELSDIFVFFSISIFFPVIVRHNLFWWAYCVFIVCLLTGEIIQRIVFAVRAATNWPQSFMVSIKLKPIRSRKSNEIDDKRCNYQDTGNF